MRFAAALALTRTADDIKTAMVDAVPKHFTVRNRWTANGFRRVRARKGRNPTAVVGHRDTYMRDQSVGAVRQDTAAPSRKLRGKKNRTIRKSKFPRAVRAKPRSFLASRSRLPSRFRLRVGERLILRRMGRGGRRLRIQYRLMASQTIKPRFPFEKIGRRVTGERLEPNIRAAVAHAARTAK